MYKKHCFGKVNFLEYNIEDEMPNKSFGFRKKDNADAGVRVVCEKSFLSPDNVLLPIKLGINGCTMKEIVEQAELLGAHECHIVDTGCSSFYQYGTSVRAHEDIITQWRTRKWGGRKLTFKHKKIFRKRKRSTLCKYGGRK